MKSYLINIKDFICITLFDRITGLIKIYILCQKIQKLSILSSKSKQFSERKIILRKKGLDY